MEPSPLFVRKTSNFRKNSLKCGIVLRLVENQQKAVEIGRMLDGLPQNPEVIRRQFRADRLTDCRLIKWGRTNHKGMIKPAICFMRFGMLPAWTPTG